MKQPVISRTKPKGQQGATMLEYSIIVGLVVLGAIALLPGVGDFVTGAFQALVDGL